MENSEKNLNLGQYLGETCSNNKNQEGLQTQWLDSDFIPEKPTPEKSWRYYILCLKTGKEFAVYKNKEDAHYYAEKYYKDVWVYSYEPTLLTLMQEERKERMNNTFQSGRI